MNNNNKSKKDIFTLAKKMQKPIIKSGFILTFFILAYSLLFSTDVYELFYFTDKSFLYVKGSEIYFLVQDFNKLLFVCSILFIISGISMLVFFTHTRRKYYLSNYITSILFSIIAVVLAIIIIVNVVNFRIEYLKVDFEQYYKNTQDFPNYRYVKSTFYFDLGIVLGVLMLIEAVLVVVNLIFKTKMMKKEEKMDKKVYALAQERLSEVHHG
jgi:uncharacterized membrane protein HdeD (DUF308 family)